MAPRAYPCKTAALTTDEQRRAIAEGRIVLLEQGPRVMGDSEVYYRVAKPTDLDPQGRIREQGIVFPHPVTPGEIRDLANRGYAWVEEALRDLVSSASGPSTPPALTGEGRARLERAEACFDLRLLALLPTEAGLAAAGYVELFELHAADPSPERRQRATAWAEAGGFELLDRDVVAGIAVALRAVAGDDCASFVDDAERWLRETRRAWRERAEWKVATGGEPSIPAFADDQIPSILRVHRPPLLDEQRLPDAPAARAEEREEATQAEGVRPVLESPSASPDPVVVVALPGEPHERHLACRICSQLGDEESATEFVHASNENTSLPDATLELKPAGSAGRGGLMRCPECGTFYLHRHHYEFLLIGSGSYDEYTLTRLTDVRAAEYLAGQEP